MGCKRGIAALMLCAAVSQGEIFDDFEGYASGAFPGGLWQDAADYIVSPSNPGPTVSVIDTTDAFGAATRAAQINDAIGSSGGLMSRVEHTSVQRFEVDLRLDQRGNGSAPNWMSAVGFFQDTGQDDFNWGPQAVVYASNNGRFRLYVRNDDGQNTGGRDFGLGAGAQWSLDTWYRVALEADTGAGVFSITITDIATGSVLSDVSRTVTGWDPRHGRYDLVSVNDGEYGTNPGTIGNISSYDNARYVPAPGGACVLGVSTLLLGRRRRTGGA